MIIFDMASKIIAIWNWFIKPDTNFWRFVVFKSKYNFAPEAIAWSPARLIKKKSYVAAEGQKVTLKDVI